MEGRTATLVLVRPDGELLGQLPPVDLALPWWPEASDVAAAVRERDRIEVTVLRLLSADRATPMGGRVMYLAETRDPLPSLVPWRGSLEDHPLRMPWARPGGPAADVAWADEEIARLGRARVGAPQQIRTWNLSSLWRLPLDDGSAWLKCVPPFFAHEGALIERLAAFRVPRLFAREAHRMLLAEIPGEDLYDPTPDELHALVASLVEIQAAQRTTVDELRSLGLPDWRAATLEAAIRDVVARTALEAGTATRLHQLADALPDRFSAVDRCGLPATLVHGDFHPGNARGRGGPLTLLDWGDAGIGHPLLDQPAFLDRVAPELVPDLVATWTTAWRRYEPRADVARAGELLAAVAAARQAVIYRGFLDRIEPSERVYHAADPAAWLERSAALV